MITQDILREQIGPSRKTSASRSQDGAKSSGRLRGQDQNGRVVVRACRQRRKGWLQVCPIRVALHFRRSGAARRTTAICVNEFLRSSARRHGLIANRAIGLSVARLTRALLAVIAPVGPEP